MRKVPPHHIAFVLTSFARGGMEMRLADVVHALDKTRWNPHVYALYDRNLMEGVLSPERLHTPFSHGKTDPFPPLRLARVFRRHKTVIVWALAQGFAAAWGRLGAILGGVPIRILSMHDNAPLTPITRLLMPFTDVIVTNSRASAEVIRRQGIPSHKLRVLYNGVDTDRYSPGADQRTNLFNISPDRPVIINIGRLFPEKGRDVMLRAAVRLVQRENPPLIVFVGEGAGSQRRQLESLANQLGLAAHVCFLGIRDDVPNLLRSSDIVVMSSRDVPFGESCPNVVLEGMAAGLPVVGTRVGGTAELIIEGSTGFLIPPDDPSSLAARLEKLLDDADLRRRMGAAGRARVEAHFSLAQMAAGRAALFEEQLQAKRIIE